MLLPSVLSFIAYSAAVSASIGPSTFSTSWHLPSYDEIYDEKTGCVPEGAFRGIRTAVLHLKRGTAYPAGVEKNEILVNGLSPAPAIVAVEGEALEVVVKNDLNEATTIHFHGMYQPNGLNLYDVRVFLCYALGVVLVSVGSFQYADGLRGPFVVLPRCQRPILKGVEQHLIWFSEHYFNTSEVLVPAYNSSANQNGIPSPDSGLINGVGRYNCDGYLPPGATCRDVARPYIATVEQGKTYYFHFYCMSSIGGFNVSIAGHEMTILETDGDDIYPATTDTVEIAIGQRIAALVTANKRLGNYQIKIRMSLANVNAPSPYFNENFTAALHYVGAPKPTWDNLVMATDSRLQTRLRDYGPGFAPIKYRPPTTVDKQIFVYWGFFQTNKNTTLYPFMTYRVDNAYPVKNSTWVAQPIPLLGLVKLGKDIPGKANPLFIEAGENVEIVIQNAGLQPHVWHLHGQSFFITGHGRTAADNVTSAQVAAGTNLEGAAYRDSLWIPVNEWFALRFKADNPGVWAFHCHVEFHLLTGMAINFVVGAKEIRDNFHLSRAWWNQCAASADAGVLPPWHDEIHVRPGNHTMANVRRKSADPRKHGHTCAFG
ncbi:hypothetical protein SeLEV6574_g04071 [Synchytrium endobioticum]|uniref:Plastocyanin-like domain-containing protein n=1 Tax=Synchytrium endobioticum TaxID=286115 RepID=A0A507D113_9FUNG|nr:hypothetical protein SeLEV6574_g04071 [Synchytrium endobioticum]